MVTVFADQDGDVAGRVGALLRDHHRRVDALARRLLERGDCGLGLRNYGDSAFNLTHAPNAAIFWSMARLARVVIPGHPHLVTQGGNGRARTFFSEGDGVYVIAS
jgi:hypothetical protein